MNIPDFVEIVEEVSEDGDASLKYLLTQLPKGNTANFISTHKPNAHVIVNTELQTLEIYLPAGGAIYASLIDLVGDTNPWGA